MFTGIVEDTGVVSLIRFGDDPLLGVRPSKIAPGSVTTGESISVNGICLTVVSVENGVFFTQPSEETVSKTTISAARKGSAVNLERSVSPAGLMGGHIVTGHIDGVGTVESVEARAESFEFWFCLPGGFMKYVAPKGCIAVNGVSLTVNEANENAFSVNIIPHTFSNTNFSSLSCGDKVNFECDIVAKYVERLVDFGGKT